MIIHLQSILSIEFFPNDQLANRTSLSTVINPLSIHIFIDDGQVNLNEIHALQYQLIQPTRSGCFKTHHHEYFHEDTGTNVHATTKKSDFLVYYEHKKIINIATRQKTQ